MNLEIWTDGSGTSKGPWGSAAVLVYVDRNGEVHERDVLTWGDEGTNNVAELMAVIIGLETLTRPCEVEVVTDSEYVMFGFAPCDGRDTGRVHRWKANGWMTTTKPRREVKNRELWQRLEAQVHRHQVSWRHVNGHNGEELNERADELAGMARQHAMGKLDLTALFPEPVPA